MASLLATLLLTTLMLSSGAARAQAPFDPEKCPLRAEVQVGGHISHPMNLPYPGYHDEIIPESAARKFKEAAALYLQRIDAETLQSLTCDNFFQHIDRLSAPKGRWLYIAQISISTWQYDFLFVLFDPANGVVSRVVASLDARWTVLATVENFYPPGQKDGQLISWADLYGDENPALVFEHVGHNGTMYNAAIYRYYHVEPDLTLKPVLALEGYLYGEEPNTYYTRELSRVRDRVWKLATIFHDALGKTSDVGYALVESHASGEPFHILELHPKKNTSRNMLISGWSNNTDELLVNGGY